MEEPFEFTAQGWIRIKGRGFLANVNEGLPEGIWDPSQLAGKRVKINGEIFTVDGVDKYMIGGLSPNSPYKFKFGLLVK